MKLRTVIDELQCLSWKASREELLGAEVLLTPEYDVSATLNMKYVRLCQQEDFELGKVKALEGQILLVHTGLEIPSSLKLTGAVVAISHKGSYNDLRMAFVDLPSKVAVLALRKNRIFEAYLSSYNLTQFAERASEVLGNPVIITNADQRLLASVGTFPEDLDEVQEILAQGYVSDTVAAEMEEDGVLASVRTAHHSLVSFNARRGNRWVVAIIYYHHLEMGRFDVLEFNAPITGFDLELVDFAGQLAGVMIDRLGAAGERVGFGSSALDDLISGSFVNEKIMHSQLMLTNLTLDVSYVMMVFLGIQGADRDYHARVGNIVFRAIRNSLWCVHENRLCVLVPIGKNETVGYDDYERTIRTLNENTAFIAMLEHNNLRAFVSEPFTDLSLSPGRFRQCVALVDAEESKEQTHAARSASVSRDSMRPLTRLADGNEEHQARNRLIFFWEHRFSILASTAGSFDQVEMMLDKRVVAMAAYDRQHGTSYLETAIMSVRFPGSPAEAAAALNVHRNTYFYRMNKVRKLFFLDLRDGDDRLEVAFSTRIMEGMGETPLFKLT